jgi:hypothetical protein
MNRLRMRSSKVSTGRSGIEAPPRLCWQLELGLGSRPRFLAGGDLNRPRKPGAVQSGLMVRISLKVKPFVLR